MTLQFDWANFTPVASFAGGALIGLAAVMLMLFQGRIAGISGILGAILQWRNTPRGHLSGRLEPQPRLCDGGRDTRCHGGHARSRRTRQNTFW